MLPLPGRTVYCFKSWQVFKPAKFPSLKSTWEVSRFTGTLEYFIRFTEGNHPMEPKIQRRIALARYLRWLFPSKRLSFSASILEYWTVLSRVLLAASSFLRGIWRRRIAWNQINPHICQYLTEGRGILRDGEPRRRVQSGLRKLPDREDRRPSRASADGAFPAHLSGLV